MRIMYVGVTIVLLTVAAWYTYRQDVVNRFLGKRASWEELRAKFPSMKRQKTTTAPAVTTSYQSTSGGTGSYYYY